MNGVKSRAHSRGAIELRVPASSANLGPAFDSAALALDLYLRLRAEAADDFSVEAQGRDAVVCSGVERNLVLDTYRQVLASAQQECIPLALRVENEIPVGKGCGSTAAARVACIMLAAHFGRLDWSREQILAEAIRLEGHADNVAACCLGGLILVQSRARVSAVRLPIACDWPLLLVVPRDALSTSRSRALVPALYGREVVVANLQSAMALVAAYSLGREELFSTAQQDALHQPYRSKICPLLGCLQPLAGSNGVLAVALSGAGSSVLLTLRSDAAPEQVRAAVIERLQDANLQGELIFTRMAGEGAAVMDAPAGTLAGERV